MQMADWLEDEKEERLENERKRIELEKASRERSERMRLAWIEKRNAAQQPAAARTNSVPLCAKQTRPYEKEWSGGESSSDEDDGDDDIARELEIFMLASMPLTAQEKLRDAKRKTCEKKAAIEAKKQKLAREQLENYAVVTKRKQEEHLELLKTDENYASRFDSEMQNMEPDCDTTSPTRRVSKAPKGNSHEPFMDEAYACWGPVSFSLSATNLATKSLLMLLTGHTEPLEKGDPCVLKSDAFSGPVFRLFENPEFLHELALIPRKKASFRSAALGLSARFHKSSIEKGESPEKMWDRLHLQFADSIKPCIDPFKSHDYAFNALSIIMLMFPNASWGPEFWNTYRMKSEGAASSKSGSFKAVSSWMHIWHPRAPTNMPLTVLSYSKSTPHADVIEQRPIYALMENVHRETVYPGCGSTYPGRTIRVFEESETQQLDHMEAKSNQSLYKRKQRQIFMQGLYAAFCGERPSSFSYIENRTENHNGDKIDRCWTSMDSYTIWAMHALKECHLDPVVRELIRILLEGSSTKAGCAIGGEHRTDNLSCPRAEFFMKSILTYSGKNPLAIRMFIDNFWNKYAAAASGAGFIEKTDMDVLYKNAILFSHKKKEVQQTASFFTNCLDHRAFAFFALAQAHPYGEICSTHSAFSNSCNELLGYVLSKDLNVELAMYRKDASLFRTPSLDVAIAAASHIMFPGGLPSNLDMYANISAYVTRTPICFDERYSRSRITVSGRDKFCSTTEPVKRRGGMDVGLRYVHAYLSTGTIYSTAFEAKARLHMHLSAKIPTWGIVSSRALPEGSFLGALAGESHWTLRPVSSDTRFRLPRQLYPVGEYMWMCFVGEVFEDCGKRWECWMYVDGRYFSNYVRYVRYTDNKADANAKFSRLNVSDRHAQVDDSLSHVPKSASFCPFWRLETTKPIEKHSEILVYNPLGDQHLDFFKNGLGGGKKSVDFHTMEHFVSACRTIEKSDPSISNRHVKAHGATLDRRLREKQNASLLDIFIKLEP